MTDWHESDRAFLAKVREEASFELESWLWFGDLPRWRQMAVERELARRGASEEVTSPCWEPKSDSD